MESSPANVSQENCEKLYKDTEDKNQSQGEEIENGAKNKNTNIEGSKDDLPGIEDEDLDIEEVEATKDFGGNIDEDELLKDTEGDTETESAAAIKPLPSDNNVKGDVDSTDENTHVHGQSTENESNKENESISLHENSNTRDGIPDSSNENLKAPEMNDSFTLELTEENEENGCASSKHKEKVSSPIEISESEGNECTSKDKEEGSIEISESLNVSCSERELSEAETVVTSSNSELIDKNSETSLQNSSDTNNEINENSNSNLDEIDNDSSNTGTKDVTKIDSSNTLNKDEIKNDSSHNANEADGSNSETVENVNLNIGDESNENTNTSHDDESKNKGDSSESTKCLLVDQENSHPEESSNEKTNSSHDDENKNKDDSSESTKFVHVDQENSRPEESSNEKTNTSQNDENKNKDDSSESTKFLHVDQENSRPEESFEPMEIGGEDPFAQTSDVAMDTSESSEKEVDLNRSDNVVGAPESNNKEEGKSADPMDTSASVEIEKGLDKPEARSSSVEVIDVDDDTPDSAGNCEIESEQTTDVPAVEDESAVGNSNEVEKNVTTEVSDTKDAVSGDQIVNTEDNSRKSDGILKNNQDINIAMLLETSKKQVGNNEKGVNSMALTQKYKSGRPTGSRNKRKSSTEDSSDSDFDLQELEELQSQQRSAVKRTPKRSAAQRAESQIKVLSQIDQEIKERINKDATFEIKSSKKTAENTAKDLIALNSVEEVSEEEIQTCFSCRKMGMCKVNVITYGKTNYFCDDDCFITFRDGPLLKPGEGGEIIPPSTVMSQLKSADIQPMDRAAFVRKCSQCTSVVNGNDEKTLSWETMDFCSEDCLGKYQQELGSHCANCKGNVQQASLGKYCVRFGYEVKQFCCSTCLEEFKKGLKVCSFCQKDISSGAEGFLAPVGDKGTFKDFCTPACMEKYEQMSSNQPPPPQLHFCDVCNNNKLVEIEVFFDNKINKLCSDICFTAYKFANKLTVDRCDMCKKYFDKDAVGEKFNIFYEGIPHNFCCKTCMNVYILAKRKIVPCNWCKVKKYNFDMIKRVQNTGQVLMMCSLNCLTLYQVSVNAVSSKRIKCDMCNSVAQAQYHLTMSDATIRNFCTYPCVMNFQQQYSKSPITLPGNDGPPIPTGAPKRVVPKNDVGIPVPVISSVTSLANGQPTTPTTSTTKPSGKHNLVARLCEPPVFRNKFTQTRPIMNTKSVSCRPHSNSVEVQTEEDFGKGVIAIPVPIYVPCPMAMYSLPFPVPVPFPLPIPVPVFLPTTRNSIKGIMQEVKRIKEKVPDDPFEAELLMMAEMVAEDKEQEKTSSESEADADNEAAPSGPNSDAEGDGQGDEDCAGEGGGGGGGDTGGGEGEEGEFPPEGEGAESSNTFGDDIMQMALKIATELDPAAGTGDDLETQLPSNNIQQEDNTSSTDGNSGETVKRETRGRKRTATAIKTPTKRNNSSEPKKRKSHHNSEPTSQPSPTVEEPKPDANMKLKFTFGVNAWKSWATQKNAEIEKLNATASKKLKPFKTDMLQLTTDELNFSLCLFVKEVRKPNGTPYAPDTIYYLCLGIQQYLFENGRIDNIFTDSYFETFTDALDEVAKKFSELFNDHHYIVTRVEEEHLWESKQLGAHSPHVLLSTLMFFNTKHFNLTNVDEHLLLSFSHIMKHWKRNQNQSGLSTGRAPGSRNVLLRFYPPQALIDDPNLKKKKVYEQQENEDNPLRCPVKLYEFYLSKCPESVKNRNDVFYLQPERSCVPDSPVWYSTMALQREPLEKMLNRVKMVKEINIALLVP